MAQKKVNYLNNKDILKEIHKSKMTYCWLADENYGFFDIILEDVKKINRISIKAARENKAAKMQYDAYQAAMALHDPKDYRNKPKQKEFAVDPKSIAKEDLVFRVMTMEHIPLEPGRKKNPRNEAETKAKVNFPPFMHYAYVGDEIKEVARSHWEGGIGNGHFNPEHGKITNKLGTMFLKLVERYSHRGNWRGYTYVDEMRGQALLQLSYIGLQFNEQKSDNPFAYYTAAVNNSFTRVLNLEKRNQMIRDDILIEQGHLPSYGRQIQHENELRELREAAEQSQTTQIND
jgi:hypothetical protein|tara:strand:+ start:406 stop:1272 length:867 start_codon:yes stop_codon:yes gene_type:complete